jgi:dienelactone hydrolase
MTSRSSGHYLMLTTTVLNTINQKRWTQTPTTCAFRFPPWANAVVIIPDWDGVNAYEQDRAAALAELGYVAFAADIFGVDKQEGLNETERIELTGIYFSDPDLFIARMQSAIDQVKMLDSDVATDEIAIIGYCFGGSGVVLYSLQSGVDAKVAVAFHGALSAMPEVLVTPIQPYLLVLSGGDDPLHGNQTTMEGAFNGGEANWEITRYAGVQHGYTVPGQEPYNLNADVRSWESMLSSFEELLALPQIAATPTPSGVPTASSPPSESPTIATPAPTGFPTTSSSPSASPTIATPAPSLFPTETVPTTPSPTASAPPTSSPSSAPLPTEDTSTPKTLAPTSTKTLAPTSGAFSRFGYFVAFAIATAAFVIV